MYHWPQDMAAPTDNLDGRVYIQCLSSACHAGVNLLQVAAHEFGHSLGLGHSTEEDALMAPYYQAYDPDFKLHTDDIQGIRAIYGECLTIGCSGRV